MASAKRGNTLDDAPGFAAFVHHFFENLTPCASLNALRLDNLADAMCGRFSATPEGMMALRLSGRQRVREKPWLCHAWFHHFGVAGLVDRRFARLS